MDQQGLRDIEYRCIQEEQPACQAACPLHVDVRKFMGQVRSGDFSGARKTLDRTLPLPTVLGRVCDHPCQARCVRLPIDAALAMGSLERAVISATGPAAKPLSMPGKGKRAAVMGGDVSALTVAWDLGKKGYAVDMYFPGDAPGGHLRELSPDTLPPAALAAEIEIMGRMNVTFCPGQALDAALLDRLCADYDGVYVEAVSAPALGVAKADADALTLALALDGCEGVFGGGFAVPGEPLSVISLAGDGRRAAVSLDRHLAGVSVTASREREGACPTRLFTNTTGVIPLPAVAAADAAAGFTPDEAKAEAARCLDCQCLECVKACTYLARYKGYPRVYARQIYNNLSIVQGARSYNQMINSCTLCGQCEELCPSGFSMPDLILTARRDMVARGKMPLWAHEFALEDMAFSLSDAFRLMRAAPGETTCSHLFFPGCQLGGDPAASVPAVYAHLRAGLPGGVGLGLACCGAPAFWAGRQDLAEAAMAAFQADWEALGKPRVIAACASCQATFARLAPDIPVVSLWRVLLDETGLPAPAGQLPDAPVAVHDACTGRHDAAGLAAVREILAKLGVTVEELPASGKLASCCGFGGLQANAHPELAAASLARRVAESPRDFVATCSMCRDRLAGAGKRTFHLLDLLFPSQAADPARPDPGFSYRHEARGRLKRSVLETVWKEPAPPETPPAVRLVIPEAVRAVLEARHVLDTDLARVVAYAEATGRKFTDTATGRHLAGLAGARVTYWALYEMLEGVAHIHAGYSHRMNVTGVDRQEA
ncbi:pyridine nucleotide-disulfide oxidoreductase/dicluster-binding protein [Solidesulfovibrio carbinolicus]|uniref:[Fe-S]-binding protein n=1 Tax=Solidesulfovibrio carbinolicus TaxID=296842 RepID=A0A4V0YR85_9BACT|nr:pyridine nucleotide-disulfide oxidoreductase/dicluster-binding protein [Solidesulfovibrio carbinolicus]QAZ68922.1 [Fe-S]-binding protein [Solidesulfovibrio carbinolicus]